MRIGNALRGLTAGIAVLGYVSLFLLLQVRAAPVSALAGIGALATAALAVAGGRPAVRQLLGRGPPSQEDTPRWWLARLEPAVEDSWNTYADLVLTVGLWALSVGSFDGLITYSGDDPLFGLAIIGFLSMVCGLISLGFLIDSRYE
ncbi:hypothetical protein SAMN05443574_104145 [Haloarcula vallismortis]|uniref:Uncharacterized protein n=2 Tax=Haloarcula vallismortis TaxID=28442 RepID=M0IYN1_HALVA|nr:hypothetical protein [Haloarcula vallismortis]EMA01841.1 hypothetical protein C437_15516 [Haloarcula vallismortis ATCC 29715]SDW53220.1 hypothetical protein SAMN05443574_104145 [Haloarcula vallismortis]